MKALPKSVKDYLANDLSKRCPYIVTNNDYAIECSNDYISISLKANATNDKCYLKICVYYCGELLRIVEYPNILSSAALKVIKEQFKKR